MNIQTLLDLGIIEEFQNTLTCYSTYQFTDHTRGLILVIDDTTYVADTIGINHDTNTVYATIPNSDIEYPFTDLVHMWYGESM